MWLPPLVFTVMVESGVDQTWGLMSLIIFFAIAIGFLSLVAPWPQVLEESAKTVDSVVVAAHDEQDEDVPVAEDQEQP